MIGLLLISKALTIAAPLGILLFLLCERSGSAQEDRYWEAKLKEWERLRRLEARPEETIPAPVPRRAADYEERRTRATASRQPV